MVSSLSVLLNATLAREDRRLVTLREEMEVAEAYIFFIQQRFGDALTVSREIEEKAMDGVLPLLTIQPLLENAVEHGIAPAGGGNITLRGSLNDACMTIEIVNTGRETGKEDRERIEAALKGQPTGKHLGLANIVNRLRLIYGDRVLIRVDTDTPGQTTVRIVLPREIQ
jgi:sensor histidine kinase YesM